MGDDIFESIKRLQRVIKRQSADNNPFSHGRGQGKLLKIISENTDITPRELAILLDIRPSSLTQKLTKLIADGNIIRTRNRHDMRIANINITENGRRTLAQREHEETLINRDFSDCLSAAEQELFCSLCQRLSGNIEQITKEAQANRDNILSMKRTDIENIDIDSIEECGCVTLP